MLGAKLLDVEKRLAECLKLGSAPYIRKNNNVLKKDVFKNESKAEGKADVSAGITLIPAIRCLCGGGNYLFRNKSRICTTCRSVIELPQKRAYNEEQLEEAVIQAELKSTKICGNRFANGAICVSFQTEQVKDDERVYCDNCKCVFSRVFQSILETHATDRLTVVAHGKSIGEVNDISIVEQNGAKFRAKLILSKEQQQDLDFQQKIEDESSRFDSKVAIRNEVVRRFPNLVTRFGTVNEDAITLAKSLLKSYYDSAINPRKNTEGKKNKNPRVSTTDMVHEQVLFSAMLSCGYGYSEFEYVQWMLCDRIPDLINSGKGIDKKGFPTDIIELPVFKDELKKFSKGLIINNPNSRIIFTPRTDFFELTKDHLKRSILRFCKSVHHKCAIQLGNSILEVWNKNYPNYFNGGITFLEKDRLVTQLKKLTKNNRRIGALVPTVKMETIVRRFITPSLIVMYWLIILFDHKLLTAEWESPAANKTVADDCLRFIIAWTAKPRKIYQEIKDAVCSFPILKQFVMDEWLHYERFRNPSNATEEHALKIFSKSTKALDKSLARIVASVKLQKESPPVVPVVVPEKKKAERKSNKRKFVEVAPSPDVNNPFPYPGIIYCK